MLGILDYIPVVGTVKNAGEAVFAFATGDIETAAVKTTQAVIGGVLDVATFGSGGAVAKLFVGEFAKEGFKILAKEVVKETTKVVAKQAIKKQVLVNVGGRIATQVILNRHHIGHVPFRFRGRHTPSRASERQQSPIPTSRMSYADIAELRRESDRQETEGEEKDPAKRGEHVINNNVLNVYRDIVNSFNSQVLREGISEMIDSGRLSQSSDVVRAVNQPVPSQIANLIRNKLKVFATERYTDTNSVTYGREIEMLRNVVVMYMKTIYDSLENCEHSNNLPSVERQIRDVVEAFIAGDFFVDNNALSIWLRRNSRTSFEQAHKEVVAMFRRLVYDEGNDTVITWVKELRDAHKKKEETNPLT